MIGNLLATAKPQPGPKRSDGTYFAADGQGSHQAFTSKCEVVKTSAGKKAQDMSLQYPLQSYYRQFQFGNPKEINTHPHKISSAGWYNTST